MIQSDLPKISRSRKSLAIRSAAIIAGLTAVAIAITITRPPGPGLDPDAASYLGAAESVAYGRGYRIPIATWASADSTAPLAHFPPGYPTAIALAIRFGSPPLQAARVVGSIAAFAEIAIAVWLVGTVAGLIAGISIAAALLVMPPFLELHMSVLSEPLFLACLIAALGAMTDMSRQPNEWRREQRVLIAGSAAAAAMLVRYAGVAVVGAVALWAFLERGSLAARLRRAVVASLPAAVAGGAWVAHLHLTTGSGTVRTLGTYGGFTGTLRTGAATVVQWLVPLMSDQTLPGREWLALLLIAALAILVARGTHQTRESLGGAAIAAATVLGACYGAVLVASRLLADPGVPFDNRLLEPLFVLIAIIVAIAIAGWWGSASVGARIACAVLLLAWFGASLTVSLDEVEWALENGEDFAQPQWTQSPSLTWARLNAANRPLYTNWPAAVFFYLHRASHELPRDGDDKVLRAFVDTLHLRHGVVVAFDQQSPDLIGTESLLHVPGLRQVARLSDGTILDAAP